MWSFREVRIGNGNKRVTIIVYTEACYASVFLTEWKYYIKKLFLLFSQYQQNLKLSFWLLLTYLHRETIKVTSKRKQRKCHLNIFKEKWTQSQERKIGLCFSIIIVIVMMFGDHKSGYRNGWLQIVGSRNVFVENKTKYSNKQTTKTWRSKFVFLCEKFVTFYYVHTRTYLHFIYFPSRNISRDPQIVFGKVYLV